MHVFYFFASPPLNVPSALFLTPGSLTPTHGWWTDHGRTFIVVAKLSRQIVGFCNVPTAIVEVGVLFAVFYLKSSVY